MPRVSVIIPCYDGERYLPAALASVQASRLQDWEAVLVDDGSRHGSAEVARRFARDDSRIRLLRRPNGGSSAARNAGGAVTDSESLYLLFLDCDDQIDPDMLTTLVDAMDQQPKIGLAFLLVPDDRHCRCSCQCTWIPRSGSPSACPAWPVLPPTPSRGTIRRRPPPVDCHR